ncbi:T9SS type A sorting domain-containing protein [Formosa sp. A9]|uniref:T9SS type A sorting domain-containing protein n=1 Tax=Formosa sp. A9 TaxID=3442641 RepID=UPI003EBA3D5B
MKKIYFLLLCCITLASASYGQDVTIGSQNFDTESTWNYSTTPTAPINTAATQWRVLDILGSIGTADDGDFFFGLQNSAKTPASRLNYYLEFDDLDISEFEDVVASFDYEYIAQNQNFVPTLTYQLYVDGEEFASETLASNALNSGSGSGTVSINVPNNSSIIAFYIQVNYPAGFHNNYAAAVFSFDNFKAVAIDSFDGFIYQGGLWTGGTTEHPIPDNETGDSNALIVDGTYIIDSAIQLQNVYTETGAGITIAPTGSLTVNDITTANNLLIESNSQNYGSLIVNGSPIGSARYSRHVNEATSDLISSPLPGELFSDFAITNADNMVDAGTNQVRFGPYSKLSGSYLNWSTEEVIEGEILEAGEGYRSQTNSNGNFFVFSGDIETGSVSRFVLYTDEYASQWNLIGNPYTSYLDIANFVSTNEDLFQSGKEAVYGYDGNASDGWLVYNLSSGVQMAPGQGFFVAIPSSSPDAYMVFNPEMRTNGPGDDFIAGRTTNINKTHFKLAMNSGETTRHTTEVYFNDIASLGFDKGYDATIYGNNASGYTLFTQMVESNPDFKIAIQTLPNSNLATGIDIPLGIIAPKGQQITLEIKESTLSESATVYLEDTKTNTWTLLSDKAYTFTTDEKLSGLGRFILHTTDDSKLSIEDSTKDQIQIFTGERSIKLKGQLYRNTKLAIFDIQGRQVHNTVLNQTVNEYTINTTGLGSGIYIVRIENNTGNQISKRVILK